MLRAAKRVPGNDDVKPAGSVAEVLEAPANNSRPYLLRFLDGATVRVKFGELAVRRREVAEELATPGVDLRRYVILRVAAGSRAFGLATEASDDDRRGVYLPPAEMTWSLFKPPEQIEYKGDGTEEVCWELEKFLRLALQANPNILETLWSPVVLLAAETGEELRRMRQAFLSRHLYKTYSGYELCGAVSSGRGRTSRNTRCTSSACSSAEFMPCVKATSSWTSASTAKSCCASARARCHSRKCGSGHWSWTGCFRTRSPRRICLNGRTTSASTGS